MKLQAFTKYIETFQNLPKIKKNKGLFWPPVPNCNVALYVYLFGLMSVHMTTAKCTFYDINIVNGCRVRWGFKAGWAYYKVIQIIRFTEII